MSNYIDRYVTYITNKKYNKILIEYSEGLYEKALLLYQKLSTHGKTVIINGEPRFGSCDLDTNLYIKFKPDLIIHIGHSPYPIYYKKIKWNIPKNSIIHYIPFFYEGSDDDITWILNQISEDKNERMLIASTIQYKLLLNKLRKKIKNKSLKNNIKYIKLPNFPEGFVIGCLLRYIKKISNEIDKIYFIGGGRFHALGLGLYSGKSTYLLDIHKRVKIKLDNDVKKIKSLIAWNIYRAYTANEYGIIANKYGIQDIIGRLNTIINILKRHSKKYKLIYVSRLSEEIINRFYDIEAFIVGGCPRIAIDDITRFKKPILNLEQLLILFGYLKFEEVYP